ncbi:MAG: hypothetical protein SVK08_07780 [Halobacteriota archaeon]|nr:hypothetical protein [Halobacteriota archaeon]
MGLFGKSTTELSSELREARSQLSMLERENAYLRKQVEMLQEAVVSRVAPAAYADIKAEQSELEKDDRSEAFKKWREEMKFAQKYMAAIEQPVFDDADDMIDRLSECLGAPMVANKPIHNNGES